MKQREIVMVRPEDLKTRKGLPRRMDGKGMGKLCASIEEHGYLELVVIDEDNLIIHGDKRIKALLKLGRTDEIEAIRLTGYSDTEKRAILLAMDTISGEWDEDKLKEWLLSLKEDGYNLYLAGYDEEDLTELDIELQTDEPKRVSRDKEDEHTDDLVIRSGDLVELGKHRLLCGDATDPTALDELMDGETAGMLFTDPPYNINYAELNRNMRATGKDWTGTFCTENEDHMSPEEYGEFLIRVLYNAKRHLHPRGHYYVWFSFTEIVRVFEAFEINGIAYDRVPIIWKKQTLPISWAHYKRVYEPCVIGASTPEGETDPMVGWMCAFGGQGAVAGSSAESRWFGPNNEMAVWEVDTDPSNEYIHPTQKPAALAERAIKNSSLFGEIVLDLFGGSGSTLIGCENTSRRARIMEKSPIYCERIVRRWCQHTGNGTVVVNGNEVEVSA